MLAKADKILIGGAMMFTFLKAEGKNIGSMAESCLELLRMCRQENFDQIVISLKASNTVLMIGRQIGRASCRERV